MENLIQLAISLAAIILLARLASLVSNPLGVSAITVQILIGVLLGPSLLNLLGGPIVIGTWGSISPNLLHSILRVLAEIGLIQLMFLAGLRTDWHQVKTAFGSVLSVGAWGFTLTAAGTALLSQFFVDRWPEALAVGAIMGASSFGISVHNLTEMKLSKSGMSNVIAGSSVVAGVLALLLMVASLSANYAASFGTLRMTIAVSWFLGKLIMFFAVAYFLTSRFLERAAKSLQKKPRQMLVGYLLLVAALYAWGTLHFGSFAAVGLASLGGALMGMSRFGLGEKIAEGLQSGLPSLAIGVFLIVLGMEINLGEVGPYLLFAVLLLTTVIVAKAIGCWIGSRKNFDSLWERRLILIGISPQGEMGMLIAAYLFSRGLVNPSVFSICIIVVMVITMLSASLSRIVFQGHRLQGQDVTQGKRNSPQTPLH
jgi:Kef-type K+ transport system membrane component KefB